VPLRDAAHVGDWIQHAGGRFRVDHRHEIGTAGQRALQPRRIAGAAPFDVHARNLGAVAGEHLRQPIPEVAGDDGDGARAGRGEIRDGGLHARRARPGHRERERVPAGAEDAPEPRAHVVELRHHLGIEMAEHRGLHRAHDARRDRTGTGTEQQTINFH
jgi:hypothetical protein